MYLSTFLMLQRKFVQRINAKFENETTSKKKRIWQKIGLKYLQ